MGTSEADLLQSYPTLRAEDLANAWAYERSHRKEIDAQIKANYDEEADVLYLNFKRPNHADDSELLDNDVIVRYENDEIVGMTIMNASKKTENEQ